jgi:flagellar biosynthesis protein FliP
MSDLFAGTSLSAALSLVALALLPIALVTLTSFAKLAVVLSALRNAIGAPDPPSASVIAALALALSAYVMAPLASEIELRLAAPAAGGVSPAAQLLAAAREPLRSFLARNAGSAERELFVELGRERGTKLSGDELSVLWASFALHEVKQAFYIAFFVFLPFLVLDLLVANVLLALGLFGLTPQAVALPFKLLLFASVDGFLLVSRALVLSYK